MLYDLVAQAHEILATLLESKRTTRNEFCGSQRRGRWRKEIGCFGNVQRDDGVSTSHGKVGRTAHALASSDALRPKDRGGNASPFAGITVRRLVKGLANVVVCTLDLSICARVVPTDADVVDVELL